MYEFGWGKHAHSTVVVIFFTAYFEICMPGLHNGILHIWLFCCSRWTLFGCGVFGADCLITVHVIGVLVFVQHHLYVLVIGSEMSTRRRAELGLFW
jgi:hypothetical protein